MAGDIVLAVDGHSVKDLSLEKIVLLVRGPPGSTVHLRVLRNGHEQKDLSIRRAEVTVPLVTWRMLPGAPIAHLAIEEFGPTTDAELRQALHDAQNKGARAFVLDIRANPGGLKEQVIAVTSQFLAEGTVFQEEDANGKRTAVPVKGSGQVNHLPVCVLIDEGTASAAEIFAAAIKDSGRGKLVGTRTFGTGTILQPFPLSDGGVVLLGVRQWLTPKGQSTWHMGITPDIKVTLPHNSAMVLPEMESAWTAADLEKSSDRQLQKGYEILKKQLRS
jgi:carboxyl-terminal processing protease